MPDILELPVNYRGFHETAMDVFQCLCVYSDDLDPDDVTRRLALQPDACARAGDVLSNGTQGNLIANTGSWIHTFHAANYYDGKWKFLHRFPISEAISEKLAISGSSGNKPKLDIVFSLVGARDLLVKSIRESSITIASLMTIEARHSKVSLEVSDLGITWTPHRLPVVSEDVLSLLRPKLV